MTQQVEPPWDEDLDLDFVEFVQERLARAHVGEQDAKEGDDDDED